MHHICIFFAKKYIFFSKYLRMSENNSNFAAEMREGTRKGSLNFIKQQKYLNFEYLNNILSHYD